jgi:hypothetical protein
VLEDALPSEVIARTHGLHFTQQFGSGITAGEKEALQKVTHMTELLEDALPDEVIGATHGLHFGEGFGTGLTDVDGVVTAVLGRGVLGDTYETANTVPNLLFELVAGNDSLLRAGYLAVKTAVDADFWRHADFTVKHDPADDAMYQLKTGGLIEDPLIAQIRAASEIAALEEIWRLNQHAWNDKHTAAAAAHKRELEGAGAK